jgi:hypothetical protein
MDNGSEQEVVIDNEIGAVMVDSENAGASLPDAEEMKIEAGIMTSSQRSKKYKLYGAGIVCLLVLIIGLSVSLSGGKKETSSSSAASDGSGSSSGGGSLTVTVADYGHDGAGSLERYNKAYHFLSEISEEADLSRKLSAQNKAANWIANGDKKMLDIPTTLAGTSSYSFVQRYVLALLYHEWEGSDWTFGAKFLSDDDECNWNIGMQADSKHSYKFGASCYGEDQRIVQLFMRKCPL